MMLDWHWDERRRWNEPKSVWLFFNELRCGIGPLGLGVIVFVEKGSLRGFEIVLPRNKWVESCRGKVRKLLSIWANPTL